MTAYICPDCAYTPVAPPRRGRDGRCDYCRSQVGRRCDQVQPWRGYDHNELLTRLGRTR